MDRNLTLYQLSPELAAKVFDRIESFNRGRMPKDGKYVISMPRHFRCGSWRIFPIIVSICTIQRLMAQNYKIASIV